MKKQLVELKDENVNLKEEVEGLTNENANTVEQLAALQQTVEELVDEKTNTAEQHEALRLTVKKLAEELTNKNTSSNEQPAALGIEVDQSRFSYVWKIGNFSQKLQDAKQQDSDNVLVSEPFYSHKHGYKMKLVLCPNGSGTVKGTHVSVLIQITQGEYDEILSWPFRYRQITFTLLDQKPDSLQRKNIEKSVSPDRSVDYQKFVKRPTTKDGNLSTGIGKLVSHETLKTENYVVNDAIIISVKVDFDQ